MFSLPVLGVGTVLFAIVQISIFRSMPRGFKKFCVFFPLLGVIINFGFSFLILLFTGTASFTGVMNTFSSVLVGFYLLGYRETHGIKQMVWKAKGLLRWPVIIENSPRPRGFLGSIF